MLSLQEFQLLSNVAKSEKLRVWYPATLESISFRNPIFGIGINDSDYMVEPKIEMARVICPAYLGWRSMLSRAYNKKIHEDRPTYIGVTVCKKWHKFMTFRDWWIGNQVEGWHLDKDLLSNSREYSPNSCIFVPPWINSFTNDRAAARGDFPIGVSWSKTNSKYSARCSNPFGKREHLGYFSNPVDAHVAWKARKLEMAAELKRQMDAVDARIYPRVVQIVEKAK